MKTQAFDWTNAPRNNELALWGEIGNATRMLVAENLQIELHQIPDDGNLVELGMTSTGDELMMKFLVGEAFFVGRKMPTLDFKRVQTFRQLVGYVNTNRPTP